MIDNLLLMARKIHDLLEDDPTHLPDLALDHLLHDVKTSETILTHTEMRDVVTELQLRETIVSGLSHQAQEVEALLALFPHHTMGLMLRVIARQFVVAMRVSNLYLLSQI
jgi:hypothetical protein